MLSGVAKFAARPSGRHWGKHGPRFEDGVIHDRCGCAPMKKASRRRLLDAGIGRRQAPCLRRLLISRPARPRPIKAGVLGSGTAPMVMVPKSVMPVSADLPRLNKPSD